MLQVLWKGSNGVTKSWEETHLSINTRCHTYREIKHILCISYSLFTKAYITVQIYSIFHKSMWWCDYESCRYFRRYCLAKGHRSQEVCLWRLYGVPGPFISLVKQCRPTCGPAAWHSVSLNTQEQWHLPGQPLETVSLPNPPILKPLSQSSGQS